jgi:hypothetical protein
MTTTTYLVFGDLHGRVLPAFRLALAWQREHGERLAGLLQVGDLGYFPDLTRLDNATRRFADKDPMELGVQLVIQPTREADAVFGEEAVPEALWFTVGNHEDHDALERMAHGPGCSPDDFPVDYYRRVRCLRDGRVAVLPGGLRVGALWGIDDKAPKARRSPGPRGRIRQRSATALCGEPFDVLLTHESPRDAMLLDSGSEAISAVLALARPAFAFFGHYHGKGRMDECDFGRTRPFHLAGLELRGPGKTAEDRSVGVLRWDGGDSSFEYLAPAWLRTFSRHNWTHR